MNPIGRKALLVVAASAAVLSATGCAAERINPNDFDQVAPAFNGDDAVWEDSRNDEADGTDIYRFSYSSATETKVAGGTGEQDQPAISDQYIVWIDQGRLKAQSLLGGQVITVTTGPATQVDPATCGSLVVWSDSGNNSDIYARNLPSGPVVPVATSPAVEAYPACDEGRIVYTYSPLDGSASADIRLYNTANGQTSVVSNQPWNEWRPSISGNRVVWQAWPGQPDPPGIQIYGKDLSTNQPFQVSPGQGNQTAPVISGSTVAWEDVRSAHPPDLQIRWRDIATTMPGIPVDSSLGGSQQSPSLFGRQVVFQSDSAGPWNTFLAQLLFFTR